MVADHLLEETNKGHGQKLMALFILDCRIQIEDFS
jgi:hypothetical protein